MARRAKILYQVADYRGRIYDVREVRPTVHGFNILIGRPAGESRRRSGPEVIATRPLVDLLLAHAHQMAIPPLPIGKTTAKRIRKMLGINRYVSIADWWARQGPPGTLNNAGAILGRSAGAVSMQERRRGVRRTRPAGWWREEPSRSILLDKPTAEAAMMLGIAQSSVRRWRWMLTRQ